MDGHNVEWELSGNRKGYPAGDFGDPLLGLIFNPPNSARKRLEILMGIYGAADENQSFQLDEALPGLRTIIQGIYEGHVDQMSATINLDMLLHALPALLATMPCVVEAVREYGLAEIAGGLV